MRKENRRIKTYYKSRNQDTNNVKYSYLDTGNLYIIQSRERKLLRIINEIGVKDLSAKNILDIGCGSGNALRNMVQYGAKPKHLFGLDLFSDRIKKARELSSDIDFVKGDAISLPYRSRYFDIVTQFTVFTSILEMKVKQEIAKEMVRVLKKDGYIFWYDMRVTNPADKNLKSIGKREIKDLFVSCDVKFYSVTLNPFISRRLANISIILCNLLEKIGVFNSHYFAVIKKSKLQKQGG